MSIPQPSKLETRLYRDFTRADPFVKWFFQPHSILALLSSGTLLIYFAYTRDASAGTAANLKFGLLFAGVVYLVMCSFQMKDGLFIRPHPVLWRLVMGVAVLYILLLVVILFQSVEDVRLWLSYLDPNLGKPLPERSYAEDCRVYTPEDKDSWFKNIKDCFIDEFVPAHFLGWFGKAILLRDYWLCWTLSISFEILELSMEHLLPNFAECWWDHILVDILLCNWGGFWIGLKVCEYFRMKPYNWIFAKVKPELEEYHWEILSSWRRLFAASVMIFTFSMVELNAFFLKFVLWIPPPHWINIARLTLWWFMGQPGLREYYQWVTDSNCKKFGTASWMCAAMMGMEVLVWVKFGKGMFPKTTPPEIFWSWTFCIAAFLIWAFWYFGVRKPSLDKQKSS